MLSEYTQGRDTQAFIEGMTQLLKAPVTVHLLQVNADQGLSSLPSPLCTSEKTKFISPTMLLMKFQRS